MYYPKLILTLLSLTWLYAQAQDAQQMISKYRFKLYEEKKLKPVFTVKMELEINTPDGKFPATLWLMENMAYKLEMKEPKGNSIEYLDASAYKLMSANGKQKEFAQASSEVHFRKKIWLNLYPFLHLKEEFSIQEIQSEHDLGGGVVMSAAVATSMDPPAAIEQNPAEKKYMQMLGFNDMKHIFYFNMLSMNLSKIVTIYYSNGEEKKDEVVFKKIVRSPEGFYYASEFTSVFGEASVKSIQFNRPFKPGELDANF